MKRPILVRSPDLDTVTPIEVHHTKQSTRYHLALTGIALEALMPYQYRNYNAAILSPHLQRRHVPHDHRASKEHILETFGQRHATGYSLVDRQGALEGPERFVDTGELHHAHWQFPGLDGNIRRCTTIEEDKRSNRKHQVIAVQCWCLPYYSGKGVEQLRYLL